MAGRDNVLFFADIAAGTPAGTVIPLQLLYGVENVRQGYGTPRLKNVRAFMANYGDSSSSGVPVKIKNSNWIDSAGLTAQRFEDTTALNRDSLAFMRGRDKVLQPNTSWIIEATLADSVSTTGRTVYVLLEIEYSDVPGVDTEKLAGSPVMKECTNATVAGAKNTPVKIGSFDNLLQGVTYVLSEIALDGASSHGAFVVLEGFSNQKGLVRIIPAKTVGLCDQIEGSVYLTKQTYNVSVISNEALNGAVTARFEMIASQN